MKKILIFFILFTLTIQLAFAGTDYKPNQKDIKVISSINEKIDIIVEKKGSETAGLLLNKLIKIEKKIQHDPRLAYIIKNLIQNLTLQITIYEVNNYDTVTKKVSNGYNIKVYDDIRCTTCNTNELISRLQAIPDLETAIFDKKDFSDSEVENYLKENNINRLPVIIFPNNYISPGLNEYLKPIGNGEFFLEINADFNPFAKRSENGYIMLNDADLATLKEETKYFKGNQDSPYAWFEYTNFACPACVSFHKSGVHDQVLKAYGDKIKFATKHFHFFDAAYPAAEFIECAADQLGTDGFYSLEKNIFIDGILTVDALTEKAVALGANKSELNACLESDRHIQTYESVKNNGARIFGVSATPTNILVNMETGEFMKTQNVSADIQKFIGE